jgi:hypothetical protein
MRNATTVYIERRGSAWFVTTICRSEIYNNGGGSAAYVVTKAQDESAKRRFAEQYSVKKESEQ